jgi:hypothetical protein
VTTLLGRVALWRENRNFNIKRLISCFVLAILGWLTVFAQSDSTPGFLRAGAKQNDFKQPGEPEFTFVRIVYSGLGPMGYYKSWYTDWPKADRQFLFGIRRLTDIRVADQGKTIPLTDSELCHYPFIYSVECGHWNLSDAEVSGLREYLKRGGFLFCDDFWGTWEWDNFQQNMQRVLPQAKIIDLPMSHPVFHSYYTINQIIQTPNVQNALYSDTTYEQDGFVPHCRGILDENGRLIVIINWNTDLGDAWEWADLPGFPAKYSTYAYKIGINAIVYAMSH